MRSLSAFNLTAIDNPYVDSITLVEIELSGLTLYLCDRAFGSGATECVFDGQLYEPIITSVGNSDHGSLAPVHYKSGAGKFSFTVDNTVTVGPADYFSKLFLVYSFYFAPVTFFQIYEGATAGDNITKFKGLIENHSDMTQTEIQITCAGPELTLSDNFAHDIVSTNPYSGADPDHLGKMMPQVYGSAKRVPLISIDAGSVTTLVTDINETDTTIVLTDSTKFPNTGTIQIDLEQITYTGNVDNELTGCARGQFTTDAVSHTAGAKIGEVQSSYWYILGHAVNAINAVYVDGIRQEGNYFAYTGQPGDNDPSGSYDGLACIRFDVLPLILKQINVDVDEGDHDHPTGYSYPIQWWSMDTVTLTHGFCANLEKLIDENFIDGMALFGTSGVTVEKAISENLGGFGPIRAQMGMAIHSNPAGHAIECFFPYLGTLLRSFPGIHRGGWWDTSMLSWSAFTNLQGHVLNYSTPDGSTVKASFFIEVEYDDSGASGPATGVEIVGDTVAETVIGGVIAIDVDGYQDDGAGTYTGTPDALIERPDHIIKHLLIDRCGKVAGDIDSTSYTASGVSYGDNSYRLGIALLDKPDVRKLMHDIATQSRSIEFWESGTHHLVFISITVESVDKTLGSRIDVDTISLRPANRANIKNKMSATYDKEWSGKGDLESEQAVVTATSPDSIAKYGTLEADRLSFAYIKDTLQAIDVIQWMQSNQKDSILLLDFIGGHHLMEVEKGDVIDFTFAEGDQLDKAFIGLISTDATFRVLDLFYENENARLLLETGTDGLTPSFNLIGFNPLGGYYETAQTVELTTSVVDGDIYYTTDGSDPDTGDTLYAGTPIDVIGDMTIKARLFVDAVAAGPIQTEIYDIYTPGEWELVADTLGSVYGLLDMVAFNGNLYAGTNYGTLQEWDGGSTWSTVAPNAGESYIDSLCVHNGKLYGGTSWGGKLYEWNGTNAWVEVAGTLGGASRIVSLCSFNGDLYGGTYPDGMLYKWNGTNAWTQVAPQLGGEDIIICLYEFNGKLYGGTWSNGKLYEWNGSNAWVEKADSGETAIYSLIEHNGKLFGGTQGVGRLLEWNGSNAWIQRAGQLNNQIIIQSLAILNNDLYGSTAKNAFMFNWNGVNAWKWMSGTTDSGEQYMPSIVYLAGDLYGISSFGEATQTEGGRLYKWVLLS